MVEIGRHWPRHPVKVGESWATTVETVFGLMGTMIQNLTFTFKRWERRNERTCALVEFSGKVTSTSKEETGLRGTKTYIDEGSTRGQVWFDPAWGMPSEHEEKMDLRLVIIPPRVPDSITNPVLRQHITNKVSRTATVKLVQRIDPGQVRK
jgi:hypothetical protein